MTLTILASIVLGMVACALREMARDRRPAWRPEGPSKLVHLPGYVTWWTRARNRLRKRLGR